MNYSVFNSTVPRVCRDLMHDFPGLIADDAFAICGNLGHESAGFTAFQEIRPTVAGSAGGWGWAQWTGMGKSGRRRLFNDWCAAQGIKDLRSYEANYGFLHHELQTTHKSAITKLKAATGLYNKVVAFELVYEGAGVKAYDSRYKWAQRAEAAYKDPKVPAPVTPEAPAPLPTPKPPAAPVKVPEVPKEAPKPATAPKAPVDPKHAAGGFAAILAAFTHSWQLAAVVAVVVVAGICVIGYLNQKK